MMFSSSTRRKAIVRGLWLLLVLAAGFILFRYLMVFPLSFDSGYNLLIPKNLHDLGEYRSNHSPFDVQVTTGWPVLFPLYLAFRLFGVGFLQAKSVILGFFLLFLYLTLVIMRRYIKDAILLLVSFVGMILVFFSFLPVSIVRVSGPFSYVFGALGELPALAFLFLSMLLLDRALATEKDWKSLALSGLFLGLAVEAKVVIGLAVASFGTTFLLWFAKSRHKSEVVKGVLVFCLFVLLPFLGFRLYMLYSLGLEKFLWKLRAFRDFLVSGGSGLSEHTKPFELLLKHINVVRENDAGLYFLTAFLLVVLVLFIEAVRKKDYLLANLSGFTLAYSGWWFFFNTSLWMRHLVPALVCMSVLVPLAVARGYLGLKDMFSPGWPRTLFALALMVLCFLPVSLARFNDLAAAFDYDLYADRFKAQQQMAGFIRKHLAKANIYYYGWWQVPDIAFLSDKVFKDLGYIKRPVTPAYLVLSETQRIVDTKGFVRDRKKCQRPYVFENSYGIVCRLDSKNL